MVLCNRRFCCQAIFEIRGLGNYLSKSKSGKGFPRNYITSKTLVSVIETNNKNVTLKPVLCLDWEVAFLKAEASPLFVKLEYS